MSYHSTVIDVFLFALYTLISLLNSVRVRSWRYVFKLENRFIPKKYVAIKAVQNLLNLFGITRNKNRAFDK